MKPRLELLRLHGFANCSLWLAPGLLLFLALAFQESTGHEHRHRIDGVFIVHDHLTSGAHDHPSEDPAPDDQGSPVSDPAEQDTYLGQVLLPLAEDSEAFRLAIPRGSLAALSVPAARRLGLQRLAYSYPRRGPPNLPLVRS